MLSRRSLSTMLRRYFCLLVTLATAACLLHLTIYGVRSLGDLPSVPRIQHVAELPGTFVNFSSVHQHFISAHLDSRESLRGSRFVRVIVVLDIEAYKESFVCRLFNQEGFALREENGKSATAKVSKIGAGMSFNKHYFQEFILSCQIPQSAADDIVDFVVLESPDRRFRSHVMSVASASRVSSVGLVVNCVSVTFGHPSERRLIEWLEAQRLLGVTQVRLHLHHVTNHRFRQVANEYAKEGFVTVDDIQCPFCEKGWENEQGLLLMSPAINKCLYESLDQFRYTAVFDLDELIVPFQHSSYSELLDYLSAEFNSSSSFVFSNWYHFFEFGHLPNLSSQDFPMLSHPYRAKSPSPDGYSVKSIHKSAHVMALHNHLCWEYLPEVAVNELAASAQVPEITGANQHFKWCHFSANECKDLTNLTMRGIGDRLNRLLGDRLKAAVAIKLDSLQL